MSQPYRSDRLRDFVSRIYASAGVPEQDAALMADSLVQADLWGHQSHGVLRMSWYYERLMNGVMKAVSQPEYVTDAGAIAVIDGNDGVGQVIARFAMQSAIAKAQKHGTATIAVRNSNHFGTVMYYTRMAAEAGCAAFMTCNGGPAMAPWGSYGKKVIGTNPWSIAAPGGHRGPLLLDIANTGVARGKIYLARQRNEPIPLGWALDAKGQPTTDPVEAIAGMILPMAGHKGYVIGAMMDVLAGVLTGSQFLTAVNGPYHYDRKSGVGHFITVYDVRAFMDYEQYTRRVEAFVDELKAAPLAAGHEAVFYPGELEAHRDQQQRESGIILPEDTIIDLRRIAERAGVAFDLRE
ncbi:Ldh family oxidoreductase [Pseudomonas fulva]|nr:Ldh family oxidoreductase [Pseudomonas fulva]MBF8781355.1 Ldh family oxidoreductase [Pseudomonas fulva]